MSHCGASASNATEVTHAVAAFCPSQVLTLVGISAAVLVVIIIFKGMEGWLPRP